MLGINWKTKMTKEQELLLKIKGIMTSLGADKHFALLFSEIDECIKEPSSTANKEEWYTKGYKQGLIDGMDISKDKLVSFANSIMEK